MTHINPLEAFGDELLRVQNPAKYLGKDFGETIKTDEVPYTYAMAFPDLYEIGMCNQAIKILYNGLNRYDNIRCERVFAPDADFEELLREKKVPLYTLETGIPLNEVDAIGFSIGYELGISGVLGILDTGGIPLCVEERGAEDPIIMAGGPGATNPAPFSRFFDAVFIGEAENEFFEVIEALALAKTRGTARGATRAEIKAEQLAILRAAPAVWMPGKKARRAVQADFGDVPSVEAFFPIANVKPVQDHGVIEIMRGCPNGCRFCHAGIYYRPQRVKKPEHVLREADRLVDLGGYREISLTSLSSGDYPEIERLLDTLNKKYEGAGVSFQLPSLKVNSFTLPLLEKLSQVRKSGLTFAVETPLEMWQLSVNKEVYAQKLVEIITEAKRRGWSSAKFYFMVGLPPANDARHLEKAGATDIAGTALARAVTTPFVEPVETGADTALDAPEIGAPGSEERAIVDFLLDLQNRTHIQCSVNVGTFIPKPHTPYERVRQLTIEESRAKLDYIRQNLPRGKFKVSTHNPFVSFVEGLLSRGDARVCDILLDVYKKGSRLDAWEDKMDEGIWREVLAAAPFDVEHEITRERSDTETLPWSDVTLGPPPAFYRREFGRSVNSELTARCAERCDHPCGVCGESDFGGVQKSIHAQNESRALFDAMPQDLLTTNRISLPVRESNIELLYRCIFTYEKTGGGEYLPHLATQENLHKAFLRTGLPILFTNGFNPTPMLELATTLSLGIESREEVGSCIFRYKTSAEAFVRRMNGCVTPLLRITGAMVYPVTRKVKRVSLSTRLYGAEYCYRFAERADGTRIKAFFQSTEFQAVCAKKAGLTVSAKSGREYTLTVPFPCDRPLRDALAAYFDEPLYRLAHITKRRTLASTDGGAPDSYPNVYRALAQKHVPHLAALGLTSPTDVEPDCFTWYAANRM